MLTNRPSDMLKNILISALASNDSKPSVQIEQGNARATKEITKGQEIQKKHFDKKCKAENYNVNDLVLVVKDQYTPGSRMLEPKYKGPYIVCEKLPNDRYSVVTVPGTTARTFYTIYSPDRM